MLKTKTITTDKGTLCVVELPEGATRLTVFNDKDRPYISYFVGSKTERLYFEQFGISEQLQLLGRIPDITEEQADKVVVKSNHTGLYAHYVKDIPVNTYCYKETADSLYSLLRSNDIYFDNPFGKEPDSGNEFYRDALGITSNYWSDLLEWQEAQSKVWDRERTYILTKVD